MLPVAHSKLKRATLLTLIATLVSLGLWTRDLEAQAQRPQVSDVPQLTVISSKSIIVNTAEPIERVAVTGQLQDFLFGAALDIARQHLIEQLQTPDRL